MPATLNQLIAELNGADVDMRLGADKVQSLLAEAARERRTAAVLRNRAYSCTEPCRRDLMLASAKRHARLAADAMVAAAGGL